MNITHDSKVGDIATSYPMATKVFHRHQIDFCCGGGIPLEQACIKKGVNVQQVLDEIAQALSDIKNADTRWDQQPLAVLIGHLLTMYHKSLHEELPRLEAMARKVVDVHGDKMPDILPKILTVYLGLKAELDQHLAKEEQILFPMILQGRGAAAAGPISVMNHEHEIAGEALRQLRHLTNNYTVPAEACNTWRALWHGFSALEQELHEHIHLENNVLFPRALSGK